MGMLLTCRCMRNRSTERRKAIERWIGESGFYNWSQRIADLEAGIAVCGVVVKQSALRLHDPRGVPRLPHVIETAVAIWSTTPINHKRHVGQSKAWKERV